MEIPSLILTDNCLHPIIPHEGKPDEPSWILCINDDPNGVLCITNISNDTKKYKEFNDNCELYIAPIKKNNLYSIPANTLYTIIGTDSKNIMRIQSPSITCLDTIPIQTVTISQKLNFEFYNDLIYNNKLNLNYSYIIQANCIYNIRQLIDENINRIGRELLSIPNNNIHTNRFINTLVLRNVFTSSLCDWIRNEITKHDDKSYIILNHTQVNGVISYMEFFINNTFINEFCSYYDISLDHFLINVHGYVFQKITIENPTVRNSVTFSMDIALSEVKGYYNFNDGTKQNLKKGDCIIYANMTRSSVFDIGNDMPYILKTLINIEPKQLKMKTVY